MMTSHIACLGRNKASRKSMIAAPWAASWTLSAPCSWCEKQGQGPCAGAVRSLHTHARLLPRVVWGFLLLLQNTQLYADDLDASFQLMFLVQDFPTGVICQNYELQLTGSVTGCLVNADTSLGDKETILRRPSLRLSEVTCSNRFIVFNITANFHLLEEVFMQKVQLS